MDWDVDRAELLDVEADVEAEYWEVLAIDSDTDPVNEPDSLLIPRCAADYP